jgi:short-subunit dehydrogenase
MSSPLVFITGASSGIGQALALRYYRAGYRLALVARRKDVIEKWLVHEGIVSDKGRAFAADVGVIESICQAGRDCMNTMGTPDVVIANAGISIGMDTAIESDIEVMNQVLITNVTGMAATFSPFIDAMRRRASGRLVGIASVAGIRGLPGHGAYCSSKAAAISYCESLRGELRGSGVMVQTLCPGYVATPLTSKNRYPMPFLMQADDFANQAFDAISSRTSYRVIPWQMGVVAKLLRLLPNALFDKAFAGQPRKQRKGE